MFEVTIIIFTAIHHTSISPQNMTGNQLDLNHLWTQVQEVRFPSPTPALFLFRLPIHSQRCGRIPRQPQPQPQSQLHPHPLLYFSTYPNMLPTHQLNFYTTSYHPFFNLTEIKRNSLSREQMKFEYELPPPSFLLTPAFFVILRMRATFWFLFHHLTILLGSMRYREE